MATSRREFVWRSLAVASTVLVPPGGDRRGLGEAVPLAKEKHHEWEPVAGVRRLVPIDAEISDCDHVRWAVDPDDLRRPHACDRDEHKQTELGRPISTHSLSPSHPPWVPHSALLERLDGCHVPHCCTVSVVRMYRCHPENHVHRFCNCLTSLFRETPAGVRNNASMRYVAP